MTKQNKFLEVLKEFCVEATRIKANKGYEALAEVLSRQNIDHGYRAYVRDVLAEALGKPEIKNIDIAGTVFTVGSVIKIKGENDDGAMALVVNGKHKHIIWRDGRLISFDQASPASEEEASNYIDGLNEAQLNTIISHDVFKPLVNKVLFEE